VTHRGVAAVFLSFSLEIEEKRTKNRVCFLFFFPWTKEQPIGRCCRIAALLLFVCLFFFHFVRRLSVGSFDHSSSTPFRNCFLFFSFFLLCSSFPLAKPAHLSLSLSLSLSRSIFVSLALIRNKYTISQPWRVLSSFFFRSGNAGWLALRC